MNPEILAVFMLILLILLLMLGLPLAFLLGGLAMIFGFSVYGPVCLYQFSLNIYGVLTSYSMVAVPLFVFMGVILDKSGVADNLFSILRILLGPMKGGLAIATLAIATIFGACTGIAGASVITIGLFALPSMIKAGYDKGLASATVCSGGGLGVIIPPSILLILYGPAAGMSIAKLFTAAIIPGLILSGLYILYILIRCNINPAIGPGLPIEERMAVKRNELLKGTLIYLLPTCGLIFLVLGAIFFGIAAPTEAAALGALGGIILTIAYGRLDWNTIKESIRTTLRILSMIMYIVIGAKLFTVIFLRLGGGKLIEQLMLSLPLDTHGVVIIMLIIIFILGMFMDWVGMLLILVPIFTPIIKTLGIDPLWFAMLFCITLQISYITPPFAYSIFYLKGIAPTEVSLGNIYTGCIPFIIIQIISVIIFFIYPELSTWLPTKLGY